MRGEHFSVNSIKQETIKLLKELTKEDSTAFRNERNVDQV